MVVMAGLVQSLDNGLGRTPGMGWNSDYCTNCTNPAKNGFENEKFIKHIADAMVDMGFQKLGYHYVNMDSKWDTSSRDSNGDLVPDPTLWPNGMQNTIAYVHRCLFFFGCFVFFNLLFSKGLGFGLYGDKGMSIGVNFCFKTSMLGAQDCAGHPGQLGHEVFTN
jgi:alpha-galactosidase